MVVRQYKWFALYVSVVTVRNEESHAVRPGGCQQWSQLVTEVIG